MKKAKVKGELRDVSEELAALGTLRRDAATELAMLAEHEAALRAAFGARYEAQRLRAAERLDELWARQGERERELQALETELEELKEGKKAKKGKKDKSADAAAPALPPSPPAPDAAPASAAADARETVVAAGAGAAGAGAAQGGKV